MSTDDIRLVQNISELSKKLKEFRKSKGLGLEEMNALLGMSRGTWGEFEAGKRLPTMGHLLKIRDSLNLDLGWFFHGRGEVDSVSEDALIYIDRLDVRASAGEGVYVEAEAVKESRPFLKAEIARYKAAPENLHMIEVLGESMQPTFNPGDEVLVDHTPFQTTVDGIYAIRVNDTLMLKRIQQLPGNKLVVKSDNPAYDPFEVDLQSNEDEHFQIIGRVVWGAKRY